MKILYVINVDWFFLSHRLELAKALLEKGWDVHIAVAVTDTSYKEKIINAGFTLHSLPLDRGSINIFKELKLAISLYNLFRKVRPDLLHLVTIKPVLLGGIIAKISRINAVVMAISGLGYIYSSIGLISKFRRLLVSIAYKIALSNRNQGVIFQNTDDMAIIQNIKKTNFKKFLIGGSGINLNEYKPQKQLNSSNGPNSKIIVFMAARLLIDKGVNEFDQAAKILHEKGVNAQFILAGAIDLDNPNSLDSEDIKVIEQSKNIQLVGHLKDIKPTLFKCDIACLPSYREGFPKFLIEAAASGKAIVTSDIPGCRDAIIAGETGVLVKVKDANSLANGIEALITNSTLRMEMGYKGRLFAEENFDINNVINSHLNIYNSLLNKK